jgi:pimeloyl-ACP methyl ester carboxylesterase
MSCSPRRRSTPVTATSSLASDVSFPGCRSRRNTAPRSWAEAVYPGLAYFNEVDRGGHFAAWEEPDLFASEVRAAFRGLR